MNKRKRYNSLPIESGDFIRFEQVPRYVVVKNFNLYNLTNANVMSAKTLTKAQFMTIVYSKN